MKTLVDQINEKMAPELESEPKSAEKAKEMDEGTEEYIAELIDTGWSGDNKSQMKAVQLLKGLAVSDDPKANEFMKKLDKFTSSLSEKS